MKPTLGSREREQNSPAQKIPPLPRLCAAIPAHPLAWSQNRAILRTCMRFKLPCYPQASCGSNIVKPLQTPEQTPCHGGNPAANSFLPALITIASNNRCHFLIILLYDSCTHPEMAYLTTQWAIMNFSKGSITCTLWPPSGFDATDKFLVCKLNIALLDPQTGNLGLVWRAQLYSSRIRFLPKCELPLFLNQRKTKAFMYSSVSMIW